MMHLWNGGDWFEPKRYGIGSGMPSAIAGWLVYALAGLAIAGAMLLPEPSARAAAIAVVVAALLLVTARHTRGGWRWRWGEKS